MSQLAHGIVELLLRLSLQLLNGVEATLLRGAVGRLRDRARRILTGNFHAVGGPVRAQGIRGGTRLIRRSPNFCVGIVRRVVGSGLYVPLLCPQLLGQILLLALDLLGALLGIRSCRVLPDLLGLVDNLPLLLGQILQLLLLPCQLLLHIPVVIPVGAASAPAPGRCRNQVKQLRRAPSPAGRRPVSTK